MVSWGIWIVVGNAASKSIDSRTAVAIYATGLHVWLYISNPAGLFHVGHPIMEQLVNQ